MTLIIALLTVFSGIYLGVWGFRKWCLKRNLFDIPNERSSHEKPTPRGGGIVIVFFVLLVLIILKLLNFTQIPTSFFIACSLIAAISWMDDLISVSIIWRFLVHSAAALIIIYFNGSFDNFTTDIFGIIELGFFGKITTFAWIVWLTNAYNFMDGIDGIAGIQAVTAGLGWFFLGLILGIPDFSIIGGVIAAGSLGFLFHNWQPAKVFMGDVGSAFLGFTFAVIPFIGALTGKSGDTVIMFSAIVLVWLFIFDTIFTFLRRLSEKKRVWEAHREHLYQKMVIKGFSHQYVAILYGLISFVNAFLLVNAVFYGASFLKYLIIVIFVESIFIYFFAKTAVKKAFK